MVGIADAVSSMRILENPVLDLHPFKPYVRVCRCYRRSLEGRWRNSRVKQRPKLPLWMTFLQSWCRNLKMKDWQVDVQAILKQKGKEQPSVHQGSAAELRWDLLNPSGGWSGTSVGLQQKITPLFWGHKQAGWDTVRWLKPAGHRAKLTQPFTQICGIKAVAWGLQRANRWGCSGVTVHALVGGFIASGSTSAVSRCWFLLRREWIWNLNAFWALFKGGSDAQCLLDYSTVQSVQWPNLINSVCVVNSNKDALKALLS